jgi:hypothetical protein
MGIARLHPPPGAEGLAAVPDEPDTDELPVPAASDG